MRFVGNNQPMAAYCIPCAARVAEVLKGLNVPCPECGTTLVDQLELLDLDDEGNVVLHLDRPAGANAS